jgi:hypothetical protein
MKTLTVKLPDDKAALLESKAKDLGRKKSALARDAVVAALERGPRRSCFDLMQTRCGIWKNTPPDLAVNKRYRQGFGQ